MTDRPTGSRSATPRLWVWRRSAAVLGVICGGSAALVVFVTAGAWFHSDEWDFVAHRMRDDPESVVQPHNMHPVMVPVVLWRLLFRTSGVRRYWPYELLLVLVCSVLVVLVWVVAVRCGAGPVAATAVASVLAFCGAGQQDMLSAFQVSFVGSVVGAWTAALLADDRRRGPVGSWRRMGLTWGFMVCGLACSFIAVPLLVLPVGVAWARGGRARAALTASAPVALLAVWYSAYDVGTQSGAPPPQLRLIPGYVARGVLSIADNITGLAHAGIVGVGLVALAIGLRLLPVWPRAREFPAALGLATIVPFYLVISEGRTGLGVTQATTSRYVYIGAALALPALAVVASRARVWLDGRYDGRRRTVALDAALAVAVLGVLSVDVRGSVLLLRERPTIVASAAHIKTEFGNAVFLLESGQRLLATSDVYQSSVPEGYPTRPADLLRLRSNGSLDPLPVVDGVPMAQAQFWLQVALTPLRPGASDEGLAPVSAVGINGTTGLPSRPLRVSSTGTGSATSTAGSGCTSISPVGGRVTVVLRTPTGGGRATIWTPVGARIQIGVQTGRSGPGSLWLGPAQQSTGAVYRLLSTASSGRIVLVVDGPARLCGIAG